MHHLPAFNLEIFRFGLGGAFFHNGEKFCGIGASGRGPGWVRTWAAPAGGTTLLGGIVAWAGDDAEAAAAGAAAAPAPAAAPCWDGVAGPDENIALEELAWPPRCTTRCFAAAMPFWTLAAALTTTDLEGS